MDQARCLKTTTRSALPACTEHETIAAHLRT
jgi:hypothetical protein